jgi:hypothetical protein
MKWIHVCFAGSILLYFAGLTVHGQQQVSGALPVHEQTGLITYQEVVEETGATSELFNRAVIWLNSYYKNPSDVTKVRNAENGEIKGVHRFKIHNKDKDGFTSDAGVIQYNFVLEFREDRYRFNLTEFILRQSSKIPVEKWLNKDDPQYNPNWESYLLQIDQFAQGWITDLIKGMKATPEGEDEEW